MSKNEDEVEALSKKLMPPFLDSELKVLAKYQKPYEYVYWVLNIN